MILFYQPHPVANMVNIITGIETKLMMDIHGHISIDITELIKACDTNKPIVLNFTKTDSEIQTMKQIQAIGMPFPFFAPMIAIGPNGQATGQMGCETDDPTVKKEAGPVASVITGKCLECGANDVEIINVSGARPICTKCYNINMGLAKMREKKIKKDIEK